MSEQYFIRLRGRVQGPFDAERLRQLARRGQFSRLHEVSADGQQWMPAKDRPELFAAAEAPVAVAIAQPAATQSTNQHPALAMPVIATHPDEAWFYVEGGKEQGPVDRHALASLFATGHLAPESEVWRSGMSEWVPASSIPGLVPLRTVASTASEKQAPMVEMPEVSAEVVRVLTESRAWLIFIAVVAFLYAAILCVVGILSILFGSRAGVFPLTMQGFGSVISAIVISVGGVLLMRYVGGISRFERRSREPALATALSALKSFWVYVGIVLIIVLVLILLGVILVISFAGSLPDLR